MRLVLTIARSLISLGTQFVDLGRWTQTRGWDLFLRYGTAAEIVSYANGLLRPLGPEVVDREDPRPDVFNQPPATERPN